MNIYFACSITGGREFESIYREVVDALIGWGHEVPTSHLARSDALKREFDLPAAEVYGRDLRWIRDCDLLIAEVSIPSHGVGYEIGFALQIGKPVVCLYREDRRVSKMIKGNPHPALKVVPYADTPQALSKLKNILDGLS